jgi:hypothetical protein
MWHFLFNLFCYGQWLLNNKTNFSLDDQIILYEVLRSIDTHSPKTHSDFLVRNIF